MAQIDTEILGHSLSFRTNKGCFSPQAVDKGTLALLVRSNVQKGNKIHDLGCGYGVIGITCAKITEAENVFLSDIKNTYLATENANLNGVSGVNVIISDGYKAFDETGFDLILCNPPFHSDFSIAKHFIEKGFNRLVIGGRMLFVVKRLKWYKMKFSAIFGGVRVYEEEGGYYILESAKKTDRYANK